MKEAKIGDIILPSQKKAFVQIWGESLLDLEEVEPTKNIEQGVWKLEESDKIEVLSEFMMTDINNLFKILSGMSDSMAKAVNDSLDLDNKSMSDRSKIVLKDFNIKNPTIEALVELSNPCLRKISVSETKSDKMILRDELGSPLRDEHGNIAKVDKEKGDIVYSNNLVSIKYFLDDYRSCFLDSSIDINKLYRHLDVITNSISNSNEKYQVDYDVLNKDMYLYIKHNPVDILNLSISKYYDSCQNLYTGTYRDKLVSNVFDVNSIPAFIIFETPIYDRDTGVKVSDRVPLCRAIIRNLEFFNPEENVLFLDRGYPDRCRSIILKMISKYTKMEVTTVEPRIRTYYFMPDIPINFEISDPYMDRLSLNRLFILGKNTKKLNIIDGYNWKLVKTSPDFKLEELTISTVNIPENIKLSNMNLNWLKFFRIKIFNFSPFNTLNTKYLTFEKCIFDFSDLLKLKMDFKSLELISCDVKIDDPSKSFSNLKDLEEIHLIYTIDVDEFIPIVSSLKKLKKLIISGDLLSDKKNVSFFNSLKSKKVECKVIGPII